MAGSLDGTLQFFLQRRTGTGSWTTIATSSSLTVTLADPTTGTDSVSGNISVSFSSTTLNWNRAAQYRILVRKSLTDTAISTSFSAAEGRIYSVSIE